MDLLLVALFPILILLLAQFYKKDSLVCLGIFGISFFIAKNYCKNKNICLIVGLLSSFYIFKHNEIIEGNKNLDSVRGCGEEIDDTTGLVEKEIKELKKSRKECENIILEINAQLETTDLEEKKKKQEEKEKYVKRLTNIKEALKDCRLYDDEVKCEAQNKCKWGKLEGSTKESCNSK